MSKKITEIDICRALDNTRYPQCAAHLRQVYNVCARALGNDALQPKPGESLKDFIFNNYRADNNFEVALALLVALAELNPQKFNNDALSAIRALRNPDVADLVALRFPEMSHGRIQKVLISLSPYAH